MKLAEAEELIENFYDVPITDQGYIVSFEKHTGGVLASDHFPDVHAGEEPIRGEFQAWQMAKKFAASTDESIVNIYVCHGEGPKRFSPVLGYSNKIIRRYRP